MFFPPENCRPTLHGHKGKHHQRRPRVAAGSEPFAGKEKGDCGGKQRLQSEDQTHMDGGGVLLLYGGDGKGNTGAEDGQKQGAANRQNIRKILQKNGDGPVCFRGTVCMD